MTPVKLDYQITIKWYIHFSGKALPKENPRQFTISVLKFFEQDKFNEELKKRISFDLSIEVSLEIFPSTLNRFTPLFCIAK